MEQLTQVNLVRKQKLGINNGQVLIFALMTTLVILIVTIGILSLASREYIQSSYSYKNTESLSLAESGVDFAIDQLGDDVNYAGTSAPVALGNGEYEITVTGTSSQKIVTGIGYVPNKDNYKAKKTVQTVVSLSTNNISFHYAVQIGAGGLTMRSNSTISGNVYSNANIIGASNSTITGDAYAIGTISAETKPHVTGTRNPGSPVIEMPTIDYDYWKTQATTGFTYTGNLTFSDTRSLGPYKIVGDLTLDSGADLTMTGPIYMTGNIIVNSNTNLRISESFGSSGTILINDGNITINSNSIIHTTSANPKGYILLVTTSTNPAVSLSSNSTNGLFYALEGGITLNSNSRVTSVVGKQLVIESGAELTYDTGLANAQFTTGPGGGWEIQAGSWQEL